MASYELFKPTLERAEGGYQNLVNDKGNYNSKKERVGTKYGISAKFYEKVIGRPPSVEDMKGITRFEAHVLFKNEFWDKIKADQIQSQGVAEMIADHAINANPSVATKIVQTSLNKHFGKQLVVDGVVGVKTIEAINSVHWEQLFTKVGQERLEYYENLEDYKYFAKFWFSRFFTLGRIFGFIIKKKTTRRCF